MALSMASQGDIKIISHFIGRDELKEYFQQFGFHPGETVEVLEENQSGMIFKVRGIMLALNRGLASRIIVKDEQ